MKCDWHSLSQVADWLRKEIHLWALADGDIHVSPLGLVTKKPTQILPSESEGKTWLWVCVLPVPSVHNGGSDTAVGGLCSPMMEVFGSRSCCKFHLKVISVLSRSWTILST